MSVFSYFKGTITHDAVYHGSKEDGYQLISATQLLTSSGPMDVDLTDTWYPDVKVGDLIECEGAGYFANGRLVSYAEGEVTINGAVYKEPPDPIQRGS